MHDIMLVGKICSGKTSVAHQFVNRDGYKILYLVSPLVTMEKRLDQPGIGAYFIATEALAMVWPLIAEKYADEKFGHMLETLQDILEQTKQIPRREPKPVERLQFMGREIRNRIDAHFLIDIAKAKIKVNREQEKYPLIIDNVRLMSEFNAFGELGFKSFHIYLDYKDRLRRIHATKPGLSVTAMIDITEQAVTDIAKKIDDDHWIYTGDLSPDQCHEMISDRLKKFM